MAPMIALCAACAAQNFVSAERLAVAAPPPRCWKCGRPLPTGSETASGAKESKKGSKKTANPGGVRDA